MNSEQLRERTKQFALRIVRLTGSLPPGVVGDVPEKQLLKSGTSVGANYCEAMHASTKKHFVSTLEIAQREISETIYWLELMVESSLVDRKRLAALLEEVHALKAIMTSSIRTAKRSTERSDP